MTTRNLLAKLAQEASKGRGFARTTRQQSQKTHHGHASAVANAAKSPRVVNRNGSTERPRSARSIFFVAATANRAVPKVGPHVFQSPLAARGLTSAQHLARQRRTEPWFSLLARNSWFSSCWMGRSRRLRKFRDEIGHAFFGWEYQCIRRIVPSIVPRQRRRAALLSSSIDTIRSPSFLSLRVIFK